MPILLRLSLLAGRSDCHMKDLLGQALHRLRLMEDAIEFNSSRTLPIFARSDKPQPHARPLHRSRNLFVIPEQHDIRAWGESVEALWRVSMGMEEKIECWDELTARLLIWRCIAGDDGSPVGEWARKQAVCMLQAA